MASPAAIVREETSARWKKRPLNKRHSPRGVNAASSYMARRSPRSTIARTPLHLSFHYRAGPVHFPSSGFAGFGKVLEPSQNRFFLVYFYRFFIMYFLFLPFLINFSLFLFSVSLFSEIVNICF